MQSSPNEIMEKISMKQASIIPIILVAIGIIFSIYYFSLGNFDLIELEK